MNTQNTANTQTTLTDLATLIAVHGHAALGLPTPHTCSQPERAFGRRAAGCIRCAELAAGAKARPAWGHRRF